MLMRMMNKLYPGVSAGFTVVELVVVIVLIGVLLVAGMVSLTSSGNRSKKESAIAVADKVKLALGTYYSEKNRYPQSQTGGSGVTGYLTSKGDTATAAEFGDTAKFVYAATTATGTACSDSGVAKCEKYVITVKKETWAGDSDVTVRP